VSVNKHESSSGNSTPHLQGPKGPKRTPFRKGIGVASAVGALLFTLWLPLGLLNVAPFVLEIPGESALRTHAGAAVGFLMLCAWAFWEK
jgi:hypothetical protein